MQRFWLGLLLVSAGCASTPIRKADAEAILEADRRVLAGCYDCLNDARETYSALAVGKARPFLINKLFEVQVLIAIREQELSLDATAAFAQARALARELPTAKAAGKAPPPIIDGERVLALAQALPPDSYGWAAVEYGAFRAKASAYARGIDAELAWLASSPVSPAVQQYLVMAAQCDFPNRAGLTEKPRPLTSKPALPAGAPPLVVYRHSTCSGVQLAPLRALRADVPRFVETAYHLGRAAVSEIQRTGDVGKAREPVTEFYERFPRSSSATYLRATFNQHLGDCREALRYYDETIALRPIHEQALLGRTMCLTFLKRTDEAIQAATRMIDLNAPNRSEAYYWRAWNHRFVSRLAEARADIDNAKRLHVNDSILTLAGMIEHDQDDLEAAKVDLGAALQLANGDDNCEAAWYLGLVHMKQSTWIDAATRFEGTMNCYHRRQLITAGQRRDMERRENVDAEFKARQLANFDAVIKESASQRFAGAYNAAHFYARGGKLDKAKSLLEVASEDPALATRIAELRKLMGGG